ncbi:SDR family oxidoreductase [Paraburkholderia sp. J67]|uniref:SDR family oxidoreductase n=1 Tax=Paraburkholderia sp. J67 TaxID=2805435 RepID=UPI002ABD7CE8|nr:SDR family oxidoreductase [Paraburkholderia sp. J67]
MQVFVTGATGFVGSAVVQELLAAGHTVLGLARSDQAAATLARMGATVARGDLADAAGLADAARRCDGVIHTAFIHDFSQFEASCATDVRVIEAIGAALAGTDKPLVVTSGIALIDSPLITEDLAAVVGAHSIPRAASEVATLALAQQGVRASLVRLPPSVHGEGDHGFVPRLIDIARERGESAYIKAGENRWPGVHRRDAARLFRLALEAGKAGARYHAVHDAGVPARTLAELIGKHLALPVVSKSREEAAAHFGWLGFFFGRDCPASSEWTRAQLGWTPRECGLAADLDQAHYYAPRPPALAG